MSEEGREGRAQQHYCRSCGAQTRPGDAFCTSCGQRFGPEPGASERVPPGNPTGQAVPTGEALGEKIRNLVGSLEGLWASHGGTLRGVPRSTVRWFRGLPGVAKLAILGLVGLGLLIVLSPVALLAVALVFGASLIGLIVRSGQRAPLWGWGIIAAASFVLVIALAGVSGAPYGTGSSPRSGQDASSASTPVNDEPNDGTGEESAYDSQYDRPLAGEIDPAFDEFIDGWRSMDSEVPLLVPTYVPFPIDAVEVDPSGTGANVYYVWSDEDYPADTHLRVDVQSSPVPSEYMAQGTVLMGGEEVSYSEDTGMQPQEGVHDIFLWVPADGGTEYMYYIELNSIADPLPYEEFVTTIAMMEKMYPSEA